MAQPVVLVVWLEPARRTLGIRYDFTRVDSLSMGVIALVYISFVGWQNVGAGG